MPENLHRRPRLVSTDADRRACIGRMADRATTAEATVCFMCGEIVMANTDKVRTVRLQANLHRYSSFGAEGIIFRHKPRIQDKSQPQEDKAAME